MKVKICGITHPYDGALAAKLGADYVGIIFYEQSKRNVLVSLAKEIAYAVKQAGVEPVGVFVNQTVDQIISICEQVEINTIQLHGTIAKHAFSALIGTYSIIYNVSVEKNGSISEPQTLQTSVISLYDSYNGGSGIPFDWMEFSPPKRSNWILAGGLTPSNVAKAIDLFNPYGVDVATGVEFQESTRKDPVLLKAFIETAKKENL